jgi:hypothetical protein
MKLQITTAALVLAAVPALAQNSRTGVSNPDQVVITSDDNAATPALTPRQPAAKPNAGTPAAAPSSTVVYGQYVPYTGPKAANAATHADATTDMANEDLSNNDVDGQIVTSVPEREGELREGTLLKTRILEGLSTASTLPGTRFTAEVMEPVEKNGRVIIPIGSILEGQVTQVHSGRRITGAAALHLETRNVTLPDGTHYVVHAQLIDTSRSEFNVNDEGTLKRRDHAKENLAVVSLAAGGGAAAGAMIGGGVGALVGAGVGAGVSTVMWLKQDRQASLAKDVRLTFSLTTPMILTPLNSAPISRLTLTNTAATGAAQ